MEEPRDDLHLEAGVVQEMKEFCYLGDLLYSEGRVERAVRIRVSAAWYTWRDISSLLVNKSVPLKTEPEFVMRVLDLCCCMALKAGQ